MDIKVGDLVLLKDEVKGVKGIEYDVSYEVCKKHPDNEHVIKINAIDNTDSFWIYDGLVKKIKHISKDESDYPDVIESEYGIRRDQEYKIVLDQTKDVCGGRMGLRGVVLNYSPIKTVLRTQEGLFIFESSLIKEMYPVKTNN